MMRLPLHRGGLVIGFPGMRHGGQMIWPRWLARVWARMFGYFWLPCPVCGEPFAGFEWGTYSMMTGPHAGTGVCAKPECQRIAEKSWREFWSQPQADRDIGGNRDTLI